jgi:YjbE family integral membrane protein
MDFSTLGHVTFNSTFVIGFFSIMLINIILSGDNAVVIAMAVKSLEKKQRFQGMLWGTVAAVVLRIVLTFFCVKLLAFPYLKLVGGILITWIAIKLFLEGGDDDENQKEVNTLGKAIVTILIADLVMSTDNVLGVAAACKGDINLLLIGLGTSIPIIIFAANLLSKLMDRFPIILILGAAVLGRVGGEMIMGDPVTQKFLGHPAEWIDYTVQAVFAVGVVVVGKLWMKRKEAKAALSE